MEGEIMQAQCPLTIREGADKHMQSATPYFHCSPRAFLCHAISVTGRL
uniref:Uncharacterized protein n=1 Tax=Anguilla anguilla TaxID=7936 RepID=A0A0E9R6Y5_ANGAN